MADAKPLNEEELRKVLDFLWHLNSEETNKVIATIAADRKRIDEQLMAMAAMNEKAEEQAATIQRMRGIIEGMLENAVKRVGTTAIFDVSISGEMMQEIRHQLDTKEEK